MSTPLTILCATLVLCASAHATETFSPDGAFSDKPALHKSRVLWYLKQLKALGEGPLPPFAKKRTNHVYRFTCLRSFHPAFCVVLTVNADGTGRLAKKMTTGKGGYEPGTLDDHKEVVLDKRQVDGFLGTLIRQKYWRLKTSELSDGLDGSQWIVEAVRDGRYHMVDRWTPDASAAIGRIGRLLLELADWKVEDLY